MQNESGEGVAAGGELGGGQIDASQFLQPPYSAIIDNHGESVPLITITVQQWDETCNNLRQAIAERDSARKMLLQADEHWDIVRKRVKEEQHHKLLAWREIQVANKGVRRLAQGKKIARRRLEELAFKYKDLLMAAKALSDSIVAIEGEETQEEWRKVQAAIAIVGNQHRAQNRKREAVESLKAAKACSDPIMAHVKHLGTFDGQPSNG